MSEPEYKEHFSEFITFMAERLDIGYKDYGDINFSNNILDLLQSLREELCDVANHAYIIDTQIKKLMSVIRTQLGGEDEVGSVLDRPTETRSERIERQIEQVRRTHRGSKAETPLDGLQRHPKRD